MNSILGFYNLIFTDLKFYWVCALLGSALFIVQTMMALFGIHGDADVDGDGVTGFGEHADTGLSDFKFFSLRTVIAFITFFGWGGVIFAKSGEVAGFFAALGCGLLMMFLTATLFFFMLKLEESGNIDAEEYVGCTGTVYLSIPGDRKGNGKVSVSIKGCLRELNAVAEEEIPTGSSIKVVKNVDGRSYLVEKIV